ncbi:MULTISPECIES: LolA family protein [Salinibaculum]|uniref:LolA family protein n=1 Tax=Salinibaculum TaxID=2732368 RepID=UPI0030CBF2B2
MLRPLSNRTGRRALLGVVGLVFVTAGCLGAPGTEVDDPSVVADQVESRYEQLDGFQATMTQRVQVGSETRTARATVAFDKGNALVVEPQTGPNAGEVTIIENPSAKLFAGQRTATAFEAEALYGTVAADLVRENEVVFERRDRVGGRLAVVFVITPPDSAAETRPERRVWIDAERAVPLRIESTWTEDGQRVAETIQFENISLRAPKQLPETASSTGGATA